MLCYSGAIINLSDIRRLFTIADILSRVGVDLGDRHKIVCPLPMHIHAHNTPSFSVFKGPDGEDRFFCHGNCSANGDVIDLAGYLWVPGYSPTNGKDVYRAAEVLTRKAMSVVQFSMPETRKRFDKQAMSRYPLQTIGRDYARSRGLNDATIEKFRLGQDGSYLCIPTFIMGELVAIKKRNTHPSSSRDRFLSEAGSKMALFNHDTVAYTPGIVFYLKGEIPAMLLDQLGFLACSTNSGEGSFDPAWSNLLALAQVIVVGDNDDTGRAQAQRRAQEIPGTLRFPPNGFKDIDEWILADKSAVNTIRQWT